MKKFIGIDNHPADSRVTIAKDGIFQTLPSRMGTGGGNVPMVLEMENNMELNQKEFSEIMSEVREELGDEVDGSYEDVVRRLTPLECERLQGYPDNWTLIGDKVEQIEVDDYDWAFDKEKDDYVKVPNGKKHTETVYKYINEAGKEVKVTDSARYKALGNSIALPQWWWIFCKMAKYLPKRPKLGSLFDGIGGFPLTFETRFGKGTARWASEIEEFPIAVTKRRFPEVNDGEAD